MQSRSSGSQQISGDTGTKKNEEKQKRCFVGSIDQGTTSTRFLIFDGTGSPVAQHQIEFKQMYPHSGYVNRAELMPTRSSNR